MSRAKSAFPRFWNKVDISSENDCWEWLASKRANGYGQFRYEGKNVLAHRLSFELFYGSPPDDTIDHVCMNKACVNPHHLEDVTLEENIQRYSETITECIRGHPFTDENTYINPEGHRVCRACLVKHLRQREKDFAEGKIEVNVPDFCSNGHALTKDEIYVDTRGVVICKICRRKNQREWRRNKKLNNRNNNE